jgi:putative CRISPR-associated protein (TIGR02619 family)
MTIPNTLISTVGISLWTNLERPDAPARLTEPFRRRDWQSLATRLAELAPHDRLCGAEINTISELLDTRRWVAANADLHFCLSETEQARGIGDVLAAYYKKKGHRVRTHVVSDLQDDDEDKFRRLGLVHLVQDIGKIVRESGGPDFAAVNATGGYKAQIALAALIGQALGVSVYYKHERFRGIICMPPMPVTLDYEILGEYAELLDELEDKGVVALPNGYEIADRVQALLEIEPVDGVRCASLTAVGETFIEGYRVRYPAEKTLPRDATPEERRGVRFRDDHYPDSFKLYVEKVFDTSPYITECHSLPYSGQRGIRDRAFFLRSGDQEIVGEYKPDDFGGRFAIKTTAQTSLQKVAVVTDLTRRFGRGG